MGVKTKTSFSSTNQPKRRRGKGARGKLIEALKEKNMTETGFWSEVLDNALQGCTTSLSLFASRLTPSLKPESPPIELDESVGNEWLDLNTTSKITFLIHLTLIGKISVDAGLTLVKMLETETMAMQSDVIEQRVNSGLAVIEQMSLSEIKSVREGQEWIAEVKANTSEELERLKALINRTDTDSSNVSGDDALATDEQGDDSEPLTSVSIRDVVKGNESNTNTDDKPTTGDPIDDE